MVSVSIKVSVSVSDLNQNSGFGLSLYLSNSLDLVQSIPSWLVWAEMQSVRCVLPVSFPVDLLLWQ